MIAKGIRGAITVKENCLTSIEDGVVTLLKELIDKNLVETNQISHVIFSLTKDLTKANPATVARDVFSWDDVAMVCSQEPEIEDSLEKVIRVLIVVNKEKDFEPFFAYLRGAKKLRPDL